MINTIPNINIYDCTPMVADIVSESAARPREPRADEPLILWFTDTPAYEKLYTEILPFMSEEDSEFNLLPTDDEIDGIEMPYRFRLKPLSLVNPSKYEYRYLIGVNADGTRLAIQKFGV